MTDLNRKRPYVEQAHRFILSENPERRKELRAIRDAFYELKSEKPEYLSMCVYGSRVQGYETEESDVDAAVFIDVSAIHPDGDSFVTFVDEYEYNRVALNPDDYAQYSDELRSVMLRVLNSQDKERVRNLEPLPISEEVIDYLVDRLVTYVKNVIAFETSSDLQGEYPNFREDVRPLAKMFHLEIGGGIIKYRKYLIDKLKQQPSDVRERAWMYIYENFKDFEQAFGFVDYGNKYYPKTFDEADKWCNQTSNDK